MDSNGVEDTREKYNRRVGAFIKSRTHSEMEITRLSLNIYKLPAEFFEMIVPAINELPEEVKAKIMAREPITFEDFAPAHYNLEKRDRKKMAEELYVVNKFIRAWEKIRKDNDEENDRCESELEALNLL